MPECVVVFPASFSAHLGVWRRISAKLAGAGAADERKERSLTRLGGAQRKNVRQSLVSGKSPEKGRMPGAAHPALL